MNFKSLKLLHVILQKKHGRFKVIRFFFQNWYTSRVTITGATY